MGAIEYAGRRSLQRSIQVALQFSDAASVMIGPQRTSLERCDEVSCLVALRCYTVDP